MYCTNDVMMTSYAIMQILVVTMQQVITFYLLNDINFCVIMKCIFLIIAQVTHFF